MADYVPGKKYVGSDFNDFFKQAGVEPVITEGADGASDMQTGFDRAVLGNGPNYYDDAGNSDKYKYERNLKSVIQGPSAGGHSLADDDWEKVADSRERHTLEQKLKSKNAAEAESARIALAELQSGQQAYSQPMTPERVGALMSDPATPGVIKSNALIAAMQNPAMTNGLATKLTGISADADNLVKNLMNLQGQANAEVKKQQTLSVSAAEAANRELAAKADQANRVAHDIYTGVNNFSLDLSNPNSRLNQAAIQNGLDYDQLLGKKQQLNQMRSVSFLDDPLTFIMNQINEGDVVREHNQLLGQISARTDFIKSQSSALELAKTANAGKLATLSADAVAAQAQQNLIRAQQDVSKAESANLVAQGKTAVEAFNVDKSATTLLTNEALKAAQLQAAEAQRQVANDLRDEAAGRMQDAADLKAKTKEEQDIRDKAVAAKFAKVGINITSEAQLKARPAHEKAVLAKYLDSEGGLTDPATVLQLAEFTGSKIAGNEDQDKIAKSMKAMQLKTFSDPLTQGMKPEDRAAKLNKDLTAAYNGMQNKPEQKHQVGDTQWNPYSAAPVKDIIKFLPANSSFVEVANNVVNANDKSFKVTPETVVEGIVTKLQARDPNYTITQAAKDINDYATVVKKMNNNTNDFPRFGLPAQTKVMVQLPTGFMFGEGVDLADKAQVIKALSAMYAKRTLSDIENPDQPKIGWNK